MKRILGHIEETRGQIERLEGFIESHEGTHSSPNAAAATMFASMQPPGGALMGDEVVKG